MAALLEAAASELEGLRQGKKIVRSMSLSPQTVPACEESSMSSSDEGESETPQLDAPGSVSPKAAGQLRRSVSFTTGPNDEAHHFPPACLQLLRSLSGNRHCLDCGQADPQWASVSYGVVLCLHCAGTHRRLGVNVSFIRSISMDSWDHLQVLSMLEGGNEQLSKFFERHSLSPKAESESVLETKNFCRSNSSGSIGDGSDSIVEKRYKTKAARFYRENLAKHVRKVAKDGVYKGREASRRRSAASSPGAGQRRRRTKRISSGTGDGTRAATNEGSSSPLRRSDPLLPPLSPKKELEEQIS